jgi:hypothetical protein
MRYLVTALVALALCAPSASAAELPTDQPQHTTRVTESLRIARAFWGVDRPARIYAVSHAVLSAATGDEMVAGGAVGDSIWLTTEALRDNTYEARIATCTFIVHEYGHVLGMGHSHNPKSVMGEGSEVNAVVYGCYKRFMPKGKARQWRKERGAPIWLTR